MPGLPPGTGGNDGGGVDATARAAVAALTPPEVYWATGTDETPAASDFTGATRRGPVMVPQVTRQRVAVAWDASLDTPGLFLNGNRVPVTQPDGTITKDGKTLHVLVTGEVRTNPNTVGELVFAGGIA